MTATRIDLDMLRAWPLPQPGGHADKEHRGALLVVAGSREMPGAATLAAEAALRAGAGKVVVATGASVATQVAMAMPEARVIGLAEDRRGCLEALSVDAIEEVAGRCDAALIGPGMLEGEALMGFVARLLPHLKERPVILDAAAMDAIQAGIPPGQPLLLTPHAGEMAHLSEADKSDVQRDGKAYAKSLAKAHAATVTLKGPITWIANGEGKVWCHEAQNPGLGVSGSGDVLAGLIAGLLARGASLEQAAAWGVALHAAAGAALAERDGPIGFLPRDLAAQVPRLLR